MKKILIGSIVVNVLLALGLFLVMADNGALIEQTSMCEENYSSQVAYSNEILSTFTKFETCVEDSTMLTSTDLVIDSLVSCSEKIKQEYVGK